MREEQTSTGISPSSFAMAHDVDVWTAAAADRALVTCGCVYVK